MKGLVNIHSMNVEFHAHKGNKIKDRGEWEGGTAFLGPIIVSTCLAVQCIHLPLLWVNKKKLLQ